MRTIKRTALLFGVTATVAFLPLTPAVAAGPLLLPWAVGHVIGAAARLATLPLVIASAASAGVPPAYAGAPGYVAAPNYNAMPGSYYAPPVYYRQPGYAPAGYYAAPTPYYLASHYPIAPVYRAAGFGGSWNRYPEPHRGYSAPGMRYAASYGGQGFGRSRGFSYRRR